MGVKFTTRLNHWRLVRLQLYFRVWIWKINRQVSKWFIFQFPSVMIYPQRHRLREVGLYNGHNICFESKHRFIFFFSICTNMQSKHWRQEKPYWEFIPQKNFLWVFSIPQQCECKERALHPCERNPFFDLLMSVKKPEKNKESLL